MIATRSTTIVRRIRSAIVVVAVTCAGSAFAPAALAARLHAAHGASYHGAQQNGFAVSFRVSTNGRSVRNFDTWMEAGCSNDPVQVSLKQLRVSGNGFSSQERDGAATVHVVGRFLAGARAVGSVTWTVPRNSSCSSRRSFSAGA